MRIRRAVARQVWIKKASGSEPLMTCRNDLVGIETGLCADGSGRVWGRPAYCPGGARHGGGASLIRALARNVGTRVLIGIRPIRWKITRPARARTSRGGSPRGRVAMQGTGADRLVVALKVL